MFFKIDVLKILANFTGKDLCWSLFLLRLEAWRNGTLLRRDSEKGVFLCNRGVFLWKLKKIKNAFFFYSMHPVGVSGNGKILHDLAKCYVFHTLVLLLNLHIESNILTFVNANARPDMLARKVFNQKLI